MSNNINTTNHHSRLKQEHLAEIWASIYGKPAWSVKQGYSSFLTFEFGEPHLVIREPRALSSDTPEMVQKSFAQRKITITGDWHLWIYCCNWAIYNNESALAHNESPNDAIANAVRQLDGQKLIAAKTGDSPDSWSFVFDLGGRLNTWPSDIEAVEQWMLFDRASHKVLSAHQDGSCTYEISEK